MNLSLLIELIQRSTSRQIPIFQYSKAEDFEMLWRELDSTASGQLPWSTVVILWDGTPTAESDALQRPQDWLTPWDWALGMSLHLRQNLDRIPPGGFRCLILDLLPPLHQSASNGGRRRFKYAHAFAPWVRWYRPINEPRAAVGNYEQFFCDLSDVESIRSFDGSPESGRDLENLQKTWGDMLADPTDQHSIANLVGPLFFLSAQGTNLHVRALHRLMEGIGLVPKLTNSGFAWINWAEENWRRKIDSLMDLGCDRLNLVLVDDHAFGEAWAAVLCNALGVSYVEPLPTDKHSSGRPVRVGNSFKKESICLSIFAVNSGEAWLEAINLLRPLVIGDSNNVTTSTEARSLQQPPKDSLGDRRFHLSFQSNNPEGPIADDRVDTLFLDLRLHAGALVETEAVFFEKLLSVAEQFKVKEPNSRESITGGPDLPWPGFSEEEISRVHKWITRARGKDPKANRENPEYIEALTILPRILALTDLSLPIVLFSSTGRRRIIEILKPYENIITEFEKPRFFGAVGNNVVEDTAIGFRNAFSKALDFVFARQLCARLPTSSGRLSRITKRRPASEEQPWRVELMLDESGDANNTLTVGGLLAVYPPGVNPEDIDKRILDEHRQIKETGGKEYCRDNKFAIAKTIIEVARSNGVFVAAASLTGSHQDSVYSDLDASDELHDERVADNLHRELVRCVTEAAIYHLARYIVPNEEPVKFTVRAPTRHMPIDRMTPKLVAGLCERWGLEVVHIGANAVLGRAVHALEEIIRTDRIVGSKSQTEALMASGKTLLRDFQEAKRNGTVADPILAIRYLGFDTARPLVEEIMREYRGSEFDPQADIIRAYLLNSHGRPAAKEIPAMHFFADAIVGLDKKDDRDEIQTLRNSGFEGRYGIHLQQLLKANRFSLHSYFAEAIANGGQLAAKQYGGSHPSPSVRNLHYQLSQSLQEASRKITGADFVTLVDLLDEGPGEVRKKQYVGQIYRKDYGRIFIKDDRGRTFIAKERACKTNFQEMRPGDQVRFEGYREPAPGQNTYIARKVEITSSQGRATRSNDTIKPRRVEAIAVIPSVTGELPQRPQETDEGRRTYRVILLDLPDNIDKKSLEKAFAHHGDSVRSVSQYLDQKKWGICWTVAFSDESSMDLVMNEPIYVNGSRVRLEKLE